MSGATEASLRCQIMGGRVCLLHSGKIYDMTDFADRHPGGREILEQHVGKDVTQLMKSGDSHVHSLAAYKIMERYYIGEYTPVNGLTHRQTNGTKERTNGHVNGHVNGYKKNGSTNGAANGSITSKPTQFDDMIDWNRPIFSQVGSLGEKYEEWVHSPVDTSLWLFQNPIVEYFSKAYWWTILLYWVPILCYVLYDGYRSFLEADEVVWNILGVADLKVSAIWMPLLFGCGIMLWTLAEYIIHRWLFHCKPPAWSNFLISLHFLFHGQHHKSPMDKSRLVFPVVPGTLMASVIYVGYVAMAPRPIADMFIAGTIMGYLCYDLTHYYLHHGAPSLQYFKNLKTYHVKHHFKTQDRGFGISSKLWDYPFGTLIR